MSTGPNDRTPPPDSPPDTTPRQGTDVEGAEIATDDAGASAMAERLGKQADVEREG